MSPGMVYDWQEEFEDVGGKVLPDDSVWLYHATKKETADEILKGGVLKTAPGAPHAYGIYFSSSPTAGFDYGDGTVIPVRVHANLLHLDDYFPGRRADFRIERKIYQPLEIGKPFNVREEKMEFEPAIRQRYRARIIPLREGRRQEGKAFWDYTHAASINQASRFLGFRYPYPQYIVEQPVLDVSETTQYRPEVSQPEIPGMTRQITTYPRVLSMEEYDRDWKPEGWNLIIIGPTSTWRQDWTEWEAIRDIVQNALDEAEMYEWGYDREGLWIRDQGKGVAVADFLLGPPKLKPDWARGKFGEGMKIASLALLRQGYPVKVETVGRDILMMFLQQEVDGRVETLAALWKTDGTRLGTTFHIIGYNGPAFEDRFVQNLPDRAFVAQAPSTVTTPRQRFNQLIEYEFPAATFSRIFARDIYMRDINSVFSYNLWGFDMAPDRFGPKDESQLWVDVGRLWSCVDDRRLLGIFLQMVSDPPVLDTEEGRLVNMDAWAMGYMSGMQKRYADVVKDNYQVWQQAWVDNFGDNAVIRTSDRWDGITRHLGYVPVSVQWYVRDTLSLAIKTDVQLKDESQERLRDVQIVPDEALTPRQRASLYLAREIVDSISIIRQVKGVHAAIIPPASDRVRTAGMYSRTTEEIYISADRLDSGRNTIDTVIHELAHHTSGAEDGEESHNAEMPRLAGLVVRNASLKNYDAIIALPDFRW